jgi:nitroimidazol reductase NimA-like FMN-containing flavoprotein (pyridoxamine 5'-phosphate oxidase superfamily)
VRITHSKHKEDGTYTSVEFEGTLEELTNAVEVMNAAEKLWNAMFSGNGKWYDLFRNLP